jgi:predicted aspartyl protease
MMTGVVNAALEPAIPLLICHSDGKILTNNAIVDTGFNGWLSLPPDVISQLKLAWKRRGRAVLGDGSECIFDVFEAVVVIVPPEVAHRSPTPPQRSHTPHPPASAR